MPRGAAKRYTMSRGASTSHQGEPRSGSTMLTVWWSDSGTCGSHQLNKLRASKRSNMDPFASPSIVVGPLRGPWLAHHTDTAGSAIAPPDGYS